MSFLCLVSLGHANLSVDIGPDSVRVILIVHAPTRPHTKHSLSNLTSISNGLTACCNEVFAGPKWSLCLHFRCPLDQTRVHIDNGKVPCVQLTAYHVVHVPLHLIHTMVILHLRTSCPRGTFFRHVKVSWTICPHLLPLSCTWETRAHDKVLTLVSSKFKGHSLFGQWRGHMDVPPASDKNHDAERPAIISALSPCISGP